MTAFVLLLEYHELLWTHFIAEVSARSVPVQVLRDVRYITQIRLHQILLEMRGHRHFLSVTPQ